jgi:hypothetical protein
LGDPDLCPGNNESAGNLITISLDLTLGDAPGDSFALSFSGPNDATPFLATDSIMRPKTADVLPPCGGKN